MIKRMSHRERAQFYSSIASVWRSGISPSQGLLTLKKGKSETRRWLLEGLAHFVSQGDSFGNALAQFPLFFDEFQITIIRAAETSGKMPETCRNLASYYKMRHRENLRLWGSLLYPILLLHAVVLLPNLKYLVLPNAGKSYAAAVLPPLLTGYGILLLVYLGWKFAVRTKKGKRKAHGLILSLPLVGTLVKGFALSRMFRTLANLLDAGVEVVQAAWKAAAASGNSAIAHQLQGGLPVLENGGDFTGYFSFTGVLSPEQYSVVAIGEESGQLVDSIMQMVLRLDQDNKHRFKTLIKAAGITAYIIAAAVTAYTILNFYGSHFGAL